MKGRYKRIAIKIGSNVLTRPDGTLDVTLSVISCFGNLRICGFDFELPVGVFELIILSDIFLSFSKEFNFLQFDVFTKTLFI